MSISPHSAAAPDAAPLRSDAPGESRGSGQRTPDKNAPTANVERPFSGQPLVLSLFPGAGLLDRGFEEAGFCVVRGPDVIFGQDIRRFAPPSGHFEGVIGGPPCQDYSRARRAPPTGYGDAMLIEFARCVTAACPSWWLMENVPGVPSLVIQGWHVQRFNLSAAECGGAQRRNRTFQFGSRDGVPLIPARMVPPPAQSLAAAAMCRGRGRGRSLAELCRLQGLPPDFDLPGLTREGKCRAVGNGVPVYLAREIAFAIQLRYTRLDASRPAQRDLLREDAALVCECGCGRPVTESRRQATVACRKRCERQRKGQVARVVEFPGGHVTQ